MLKTHVMAEMPTDVAGWNAVVTLLSDWAGKSLVDTKADLILAMNELNKLSGTEERNSLRKQVSKLISLVSTEISKEERAKITKPMKLARNQPSTAKTPEAKTEDGKGDEAKAEKKAAAEAKKAQREADKEAKKAEREAKKAEAKKTAEANKDASKKAKVVEELQTKLHRSSVVVEEMKANVERMEKFIESGTQALDGLQEKAQDAAQAVDIFADKLAEGDVIMVAELSDDQANLLNIINNLVETHLVGTDASPMMITKYPKIWEIVTFSKYNLDLVYSLVAMGYVAVEEIDNMPKSPRPVPVLVSFTDTTWKAYGYQDGYKGFEAERLPLLVQLYAKEQGKKFRYHIKDVAKRTTQEKPETSVSNESEAS